MKEIQSRMCPYECMKKMNSVITPIKHVLSVRLFGVANLRVLQPVWGYRWEIWRKKRMIHQNYCSLRKAWSLVTGRKAPTLNNPVAPLWGHLLFGERLLWEFNQVSDQGKKPRSPTTSFWLPRRIWKQSRMNIVILNVTPWHEDCLRVPGGICCVCNVQPLTWTTFSHPIDAEHKHQCLRTFNAVSRTLVNPANQTSSHLGRAGFLP